MIKPTVIAVDQMSLILSGELYQIWLLLHHPNVPAIKTLEEVLKRAPATELEDIRTRANAMATLANAVVEAMPTTTAKAATKG